MPKVNRSSRRVRAPCQRHSTASPSHPIIWWHDPKLDHVTPHGFCRSLMISDVSKPDGRPACEHCRSRVSESTLGVGDAGPVTKNSIKLNLACKPFSTNSRHLGQHGSLFGWTELTSGDAANSYWCCDKPTVLKCTSKQTRVCVCVCVRYS